MKKIDIEYGLQDLDRVVQQVSDIVSSKSIVTFTGSLGAGKTTLIARLLALWGVKEAIVSPTFTYVNEYKTGCGRKIYHFDLYRLDNLQSFEMMGFAEYLYEPNSICFIEWPEIIIPLIKGSFCHITIDFQGLDKRQLKVITD